MVCLGEDHLRSVQALNHTSDPWWSGNLSLKQSGIGLWQCQGWCDVASCIITPLVPPPASCSVPQHPSILKYSILEQNEHKGGRRPTSVLASSSSPSLELWSLWLHPQQTQHHTPQTFHLCPKVADFPVPMIHIILHPPKKERVAILASVYVLHYMPP